MGKEEKLKIYYLSNVFLIYPIAIKYPLIFGLYMIIGIIYASYKWINYIRYMNKHNIGISKLYIVEKYKRDLKLYTKEIADGYNITRQEMENFNKELFKKTAFSHFLKLTFKLIFWHNLLIDKVHDNFFNENDKGELE
jgi:hypothetical protein